jgi:hypothetical protein
MLFSKNADSINLKKIFNRKTIKISPKTTPNEGLAKN